ncbi:MAG: TonB-dependent receptor domain-containing protein [Gammaproteobacteria bacterium]
MKRRLIPSMLSLAVCQVYAVGNEIEIHVPAQPLAPALEQLAKQTGLQVLYASDGAADKFAPGVSGRFTANQALARLLEGSGMTYRFTGPQTVALQLAEADATEASDTARRPVKAKPPKAQPVHLDPIVVTATKTERHLSEVPVSASIVDAEDIKRRGIPVDLSDALLHEAGIDMARGTPVSPAGLNMRGLGFGRSALLIDGQRSDLMFWSGQHPVQMLDPGNVERIEIVRGAGSALYGPYAMGGVVNIIAKDGEGPNRTRVNFGYDSLDTPQGGVSTSGSEGLFSYNLNVRHLDSDGYKIVPEPSPFGQLSTVNNNWRQTFGGGKLGFQITEDAKLTVSGRYHDQQTDAGFGRPNTGHDIEQDFESVEYRQKVNDLYSFTANFNHTGHNAFYEWDSFNLFFNTSQDLTAITEESVHRYAGQLINNFDFGEHYHILLGFEYGSENVDISRFNIIDGQRQIDNSVLSDIDNVGVFLQGEAKLFERLSLVAGFRYDEYDYTNNKLVDFSSTPPNVGGGDASFDNVSPRGGISYQIADATRVRASAGTGFRPPTATDMFRQTTFFVPNPDLKPETSWNVDIGFDHRFDFGLGITVSGYYSELTDAITWIGLADGRFHPENVTNAEVKGAELELTYDGRDWSFFANYTFNESKITQDQDPTLIGKYMINSPAHKVGAGVTYSWNDRFTGTLLGRYFSKQYADAHNSAFFVLPEYFVSDLKFNYRQPLGDQEAHLTAGINNLFDERYTRFRQGWYEQPRVYYFQLAYEF